MTDEPTSTLDDSLLYPWQKQLTNDLAIQNLNDSKETIINKFISSELNDESPDTNVTIKDGKLAPSLKHDDEVKMQMEDEYAVFNNEQKKKVLSREQDEELKEVRKEEVFNMFLDSAENDFKDGREFNSYDITLLIDYIDEHGEGLDERETQLIASVNMNDLKERVGEKSYVLDKLIDDMGIERPEENKIQESQKNESVERKYPLPKPTPNGF